MGRKLTETQAKTCLTCGVEFIRPTRQALKIWENRKYCSRKCQPRVNTLSAIPWNKGKKNWLTPEHRAKMAEVARANVAKETPEQRQERMAKMLATRNANGIWKPPRLGKVGAEVTGVWLDNEAEYNSKHRWIQNHWQKTGKCEDCSKTPKPFGNRKYGTEWANLDDKYDRNDKSTWKELCVPCHRKLDRSKLVK